MPGAWGITTQFNAGQLSPLMSGRVDTEFWRKGCRKMANMLPMVQGPSKRRGGTRYLGQSETANNPSIMIPFVRSATEAYVLELAGPIMRFWRNGVQVQSAPGVPYQIGTPYTGADLFDADGIEQVQYVQSADVMYLTHPNYPTQKLEHFAQLDWIMTAPRFKDGPWLPENSDDTILMYVSAISGSGVTVTANQDVFNANCVGQLLRIFQNDLSQLKAWYPGQRTTGGNIAVGIRRRSGPNTYVVKSIANGTSPGTIDWIETGSDTLITTLGDQWDGPQDVVPNPATAGHYYGRGVQWTYTDSGYGVAVITGYTDARHVTVSVQRQFPLSLKLGDPSLTPSSRFQLGAWAPYLGYPSCCCFFRERLTFANGLYVWMSCSADFENFADQTFGVIAQDNAVTQQVLSTQVNPVVWMDPSDVLLVGTLGGEFVIQQNTTNQPFGPLNVVTLHQSDYGGRHIPPIRIGGSTFYVTRTGRYVREYVFNIDTNNYESHDATVASEDITATGVITMKWAFNPFTVIWMIKGDGSLIGFTVNKDQGCRAWHPHPLGATRAGAAQVKSIAVVPSETGDHDDLYLCVRRVVNDSAAYYIERMEQPWRRDLDDRANAFYVDCGGTYSGVPTSTITDLGYLTGEVVQVFADGQPQADKTVGATGFITLDQPASVVQVGLACPCEVAPMRLEAGASDGTAQGKIKRINKVVFRFLDSLGGEYTTDFDDPYANIDGLSYSDVPTAVSEGTDFFTGDTPQLAWPEGYGQNGYIAYRNQQPLPVTVCAIIAQEVTYEGWQ